MARLCRAVLVVSACLLAESGLQHACHITPCPLCVCPPCPPPPLCLGCLLQLNRISTVWMTQLDILLWRPCRSFGCSAPVGTVYSINPAMIMTLVPLVGAAATHYSHFDMIHYGSYVSALSPLWMALFTTGDVLQTISPHPHPPFEARQRVYDTHSCAIVHDQTCPHKWCYT